MFRHLRLVDVGSIVGIGPQSRRIDSFVKSAFLVMNFPFNEIEFLYILCVRLPSKKADGNASGSYKYPRADRFQTRSNPQKNRVILSAWTELLNPSKIRKPRSTNPSNNSPISRNSNQNLQQSNPKSTDLTMADSTTQTTSSAIHDAAIHGLKVIFGLIFSCLQLTKLLKLKL